MLQAHAVIHGDRNNKPGEPRLNVRFARLIDGSEMDLAVLVAETALEWRVRGVGLGIELVSTIAEMEATPRLEVAGKCERNKGQCDGSSISELHIEHVGWCDRCLMVGNSWEEG